MSDKEVMIAFRTESRFRDRVKKHAIDKQMSIQQLITHLLTNELQLNEKDTNDAATERPLPIELAESR